MPTPADQNPPATPLNIDPAELKQARDAGYSDAEITDFLSTRAPDQFKQAGDAGYSPTEILSHLSGERSLMINGHKVTVDRSFFNLSPEEQNATVDEIASHLPEQPPSGVIAGAREGIANVIHGAAETAKQYFGADASAPDAAAQAVAPADYKGATIVPDGGHWYDPRTYNWSQVPQAIAEAAPGMATDIAAAKIGSRINPLVGVGAGLASYLLRTRGDVAKQDAALRTGNPDAEPEAQDKARSLITGAVESIPQAVGIGRFIPGASTAAKAVGYEGIGKSLTKALATSGVEAGTGAASNAISQAGASVGTDKGLSVDPAQVVDAGLTSAATGGIGAISHALAGTRAAIKYAKFGGDNQEAAGAFANRIAKAADGNALNPANSYEAVRTADGAVRDELRAATKPIQDSLDVDTADALKRAAMGRKLTDSDLESIDDNTPPDVAFLARQAHVASQVKGLGDYGNGKLIGGATNAIGKHLRAYNNPVGYGLASALGGAAVTMPYSATSAAALAGGYLGLRGFDALTGNRSPAKGFVNQFVDPTVALRLAPQAAPQVPQAPTRPTGPQVPFSPGVAGGGAMLALGQSPWAQPQAPTPPKVMTPAEMNEQVKGALLMAAARRRIAAAAQANAPRAPASQTPQASAPVAAPVVPVGAQVRPPIVSPDLLARASTATPIPEAQPASGTDNIAMTATKLAALRRLMSPRQPGEDQTQQQAKPQADSTTEEVPVPSALLHTKPNAMDTDIANNATNDFIAKEQPSELRAKRYFESTVQKQARIRDRLLQLSGHADFPAEDLRLGELLDKLRHTRTRETVAAHVDAIAQEFQKHARLIRSYFGPRWAESVWNSTAK